MTRLWLLLVLLLSIAPVRALEVLDVSPLSVTPQQRVTMTVHFNQGQDLAAVRTYRYGSSIQVYISLDDVVIVGQPPAQERTESFDLGGFPVGEYRLDVYAASVGPPNLLLSRTLGVTAPVGLPASSTVSRLMLVVTMLFAGGVAFWRRRARAA